MAMKTPKAAAAMAAMLRAEERAAKTPKNSTSRCAATQSAALRDSDGTGDSGSLSRRQANSVKSMWWSKSFRSPAHPKATVQTVVDKSRAAEAIQPSVSARQPGARETREMR